ncbi:MAG: zinc ribbon domain-containing protein [Oscillospiraceae bacterium]|nr:zinc ribbon domain-containing protein [Oscillospiraceae bacterium]
MSNETRANRNEINRLNKAISAEEQTINSIFQRMGQTYFTAHRDDPEEAQAAYVQGVLEAMNRARGYKDQINVLRGIAICPNCKAEVSSTAAFCSCCGTRMPVRTQPASAPAANTLICPSCGNVCQPGTRFCNRCGTRLGEAAPAAAPAPQSAPISQPVSAPQSAPIPQPASQSAPVFQPVPAPVFQPAPAPEAAPEVPAPVPQPVSAAIPEPDPVLSEPAPEPAEPAPLPDPPEALKESPAAEQAAPAAPAKKRCPHCGTELDPEFRFCLECGNPV